MSDRPYSSLIDCVIDADIVELVRALNSDMTVTATSCSGHGVDPAYVEFYLRHDSARKFAEIVDDVHEAVRRRCCMDLEVVWCSEIASVLSGEEDFPDWLLFSLRISTGGSLSPAPGLLRRLAAAFGKRLPGAGKWPLRGPEQTANGWRGVDLPDLRFPRRKS